MITPTPEPVHAPVWQRALAQAVRDPAELLALLNLDPDLLPAARRAARDFPLRVPRGYVARMRPNDPDDPLLRQVLPLGEELNAVSGFSADPVGDNAAMPVPGLLHKYHGRALLVATGACGVHCRYCFRRHFAYDEGMVTGKRLSAILDYLHAHDDIREVILSGGDPLSLNDRQLGDLVRALEDVPHLTRLRLHTRQPVVLPERVDERLLDWLGTTRLRPVVVLHANHAREVDESVRDAAGRLADSGALLLNQSVLLRGVNDTVAALADLSEALFDTGIQPYYLHVLDRVAGAAHFFVPDERAQALLAELQTRLPGYLVPRLAREEAGRPSKTLLPPLA